MSGIYIHIPFCKKACHYCNFHFSTQLDGKDAIFSSIIKELALQKEYLNGTEIQSIYLGGGTPSLLTIDQLHQLYEVIQANFKLANQVECTLEANPDDLTKSYLTNLAQTFINRLSIGVQSFYDEDLHWMNRSHSNLQAEQCIRQAQEVGLGNITIDLIYGYPLLTTSKWTNNLSKIEQLNIQHFSAYCLTVEDRTALHHQIKMGKQTPMNDAQATQQFQLLMQTVEDQNWSHYEISNIAIRDSSQAIHNSNYWKGKAYLGVGPSAHSFNGDTRQWNVANNNLYHQAIQKDQVPFEQEILTHKEKANEYIMTSLRTNWGCSLNHVQDILTTDLESDWMDQIQEFINKGWLDQTEHVLRLTSNGKLFADHIASELFFTEE